MSEPVEQVAEILGLSRQPGAAGIAGRRGRGGRLFQRRPLREQCLDGLSLGLQPAGKSGGVPAAGGDLLSQVAQGREILLQQPRPALQLRHRKAQQHLASGHIQGRGRYQGSTGRRQGEALQGDEAYGQRPAAGCELGPTGFLPAVQLVELSLHAGERELRLPGGGALKDEPGLQIGHLLGEGRSGGGELAALASARPQLCLEALQLMTVLGPGGYRENSQAQDREERSQQQG